MSWVGRLLRRLTSAWSQDPLALWALTVSCDGTDLSWQVADGTLALSPVGGTAAPLSIDLSTISTISLLVAYINSLKGYHAVGSGKGYGGLSPLALIDASGSIDQVNGGTISLATSPHYLILQTAGGELKAAEAQIPNLPLQMSTPTAQGSWLDFLGGVFNVPRISPEGDANYAVRIIQETIRPKCNNISMARALQAYLGLAAQVTDVDDLGPGTLYYDGSFNFDGSKTFSTGESVTNGGLFDVEAGYDLIGGTELTAIEPVIIGYINRLKAAGTSLRNLNLAPLSDLADSAPMPDDSQDAVAATYSYVYDGSQTFGGTAIYAGGMTLSGTLSGS